MLLPFPLSSWVITIHMMWSTASCQLMMTGVRGQWKEGRAAHWHTCSLLQWKKANVVTLLCLNERDLKHSYRRFQAPFTPVLDFGPAACYEFWLLVLLKTALALCLVWGKFSNVSLLIWYVVLAYETQQIINMCIGWKLGFPVCVLSNDWCCFPQRKSWLNIVVNVPLSRDRNVMRRNVNDKINE